MSKENEMVGWLKLAPLEGVPVLDIIGDKDREIFELTAQVEVLQAENAALRARVPAEGDVVMVPRAFIESFIRIKAPLALKGFNKELEILQACLDAPQPRVVQEGDVVISAGVAARIVSINIKTGETWADRAVFETVPLADALARAIGESKCE